MSKKNQTNEVSIESAVTETVTEVVTRSYQELLTKYGTKSGVIRGLSAEGNDTKGIYKILKDLEVTNTAGTHPIRYQHVRNVLNTPIKKNG
jgi:hypothetical protein